MIRFVLILFLLIRVCQAQELPVRVEEKGEINADENEEEYDEEWRIALQDFLRHPVNLNEASLEDLRSLLILNELQIQNFISYRKTLGKLGSIYELQAVPGWDNILIQKLLPFIKIGATDKGITSLKNFISKSDKLLSARWNVKELSIKNAVGNSASFLSRFRLQYSNLFYAGILLEKDGGEPWLQGGIPDFLSFHFYLKGGGKLKALSLGDYKLRVGQGLLVSSRSFKTDVISIREGGDPVSAYRSTGEVDYFRGAAIVYSVGKMELIPFLSFKKLSVTKDGEGFSSFRRSGLYRTQTEISHRNNLENLSLGGLLKFHIKGWELGLNFISQKLSLPRVPQAEPYLAFDPKGSEFMHLSLDWGKSLPGIYFFGELAASKSFKPALVAGIMAALHPKADLAFRVETVSLQFQNPFSEIKGGRTSYYLGLLFRASKFLQVSFSADLSRNAWLGFQKPGPSSEGRLVWRADLMPDKKTDIIFRILFGQASETWEINGMKGLFRKVEQGYRFQFRKELSSALTLNGKLEILRGKDETSLMSSIDAKFKWKSYSVSLSGTLHNSEGASRFYSQSPFFLNGNGNFSLSGTGSQLVCLFRRLVKRGIILEGRACFRSNQSSEIGFQVVLELNKAR